MLARLLSVGRLDFAASTCAGYVVCKHWQGKRLRGRELNKLAQLSARSDVKSAAKGGQVRQGAAHMNPKNGV
jgi:hypothetical protein